MNNFFKYLLVVSNMVLFIVLIPLTMSTLLINNLESANTTIIGFMLLIISIILFLNALFILSINIKKYDDQKHLRLVERRWNIAAYKLEKVLQKFNQDIKKEIINDVIKNTE